MNKKIGLIVVGTLFLAVALFNAPLTFAQNYDGVQISAYASDLAEDFPAIGSFTFTVAALPQGSEFTNSISAHNVVDDLYYSMNLSVGDIVQISTVAVDVITMNLNPAPEAGYFTISYEGEAQGLNINAQTIPEFPTFIVIPLFIIATLLAIIYEKRTSHSKLKD